MAIKINPNIKNVGLKHGASGGLMVLVAFIVFFYLGQQPWRNLISFVLDAIIIGTFCFLAIREFKVNWNGGELRFYHGMTIGFIVYLLVSFIFSMGYAVFINWVEPDFLSNYVTLAVEDLTARKDILLESVEKNPEAFFQEQIDNIKSITRSQIILDAFLKRLLIGLFVTPVISIALRTNQK